MNDSVKINNNEISIIVSGNSHVGKTTIIAKIMAMLHQEGFTECHYVNNETLIPDLTNMATSPVVDHLKTSKIIITECDKQLKAIPSTEYGGRISCKFLFSDNSQIDTPAIELKTDLNIHPESSYFAVTDVKAVPIEEIVKPDPSSLLGLLEPENAIRDQVVEAFNLPQIDSSKNSIIDVPANKALIEKINNGNRLIQKHLLTEERRQTGRTTKNIQQATKYALVNTHTYVWIIAKDDLSAKAIEELAFPLINRDHVKHARNLQVVTPSYMRERHPTVDLLNSPNVFIDHDALRDILFSVIKHLEKLEN